MRRAVWLAARGAWFAAIRALWEDGPQVVQLALALNAFGFGCILLDPTPTFTTSHSYDWMAAHGSESQWGGVFLTMGMIGFCGVCSRGRGLKVAAAGLTSLHVGLTGWSYYISNPAGTGWFTYASMTLLGYWLFWKRIQSHA